jgi:FkbM family methyltransferase
MIKRIKAFIGVLKDSKHPFRFVIGMILMKSGLNRFFTIRMNGYKINFSRSALAVTLFADSKERHEDEDFLKRILRPGQVYMDIGANIGTLVLTASPIVEPGGKVIAVEAHPVTFKHLEANVALNKFSNIFLVNSAAGERQGHIFFSNINSDDQNKVLLQHSKGIEVKVDKLDNIFAAEPRIDLLKIDVEGYEKFVLQGAASTLNKTGVVYFESWEKHFNGFGYDTIALLDILRHSGFKIYKAGPDTLMNLPVGYRSEFCENLVAIKDPELFCITYGYRLVKP